MKLAFLYGRWSCKIHGGFDFEHLFDGPRGLTGSESSFINVVRSMAELGHEVYVHCPVTNFVEKPALLKGAKVIAMGEDDFPRVPTDCDVYIAWNEPDLLRFVPKTAVRIVDHQLNDFGFCYEGYDAYVDHYVLVSKAQAANLVALSKLDMEKVVQLPNSIDLDFFGHTTEPRDPHSIAYTSSPDRGLHHLLKLFPRVREQIPDASLHVYYEWTKVFERDLSDGGLKGIRFRYIDRMVKALGTEGENGLFIHGSVNNMALIAALEKTRVFAYTCDPFRFTEGFSVSTLDACAAGCYPIISDTDALGEIYSEAAHVIRGNPAGKEDVWVSAIVDAMTDDALFKLQTDNSREWAKRLSRQNIAPAWEMFLTVACEEKRRQLGR